MSEHDRADVNNLHSTVLYFRDSRVHSWPWKPLIEKYGHLRMFIDPDYLKSATFIVKDGDPVSTVFFVRMPLYNPRVPVSYDNFAVTTQHSVKDNEVSIRFNLKSGGLYDEPINPNDWIHHTETDISILPVKFPVEDYDVKFIDSYEMARDKDYLISIDERLYEMNLKPGDISLMHRYGVGDEVFSIGLFAGLAGEKIAQPAARFGHIALKPAEGEKIIADVGGGQYKPIDAFLIEIAALRGQSGSPVFLRPWVSDERTITRPIWEYNFLIGMVQGFYPIEHEARIQERKFNITVETGLCIVITTRPIAEMLMEDSLVKDRKERLEKIREEKAKSVIKPQALSISKPDGQGITQEGFGEASRRASRKTSVPDEEMKGEES